MPSEPMMVAIESGSCNIDGIDYSFHREISRLRADHPVVQAQPQFFKRVDPESSSPEVEQATAAPGEKRGARGKKVDEGES